MLLMHILISIVSLLVGGVGIIWPSKKGLLTNLGLTVLTITTGILLVVEGYDMFHFCVSGLMMLGAMTLMSLVSLVRLKRITTTVLQ